MKSSPTSPKKSKETRSPRKASKELKLKEMKSKFKFRNLGRVKVSALKEILRDCKVEPGFVVVYMKFGVAIVMFKEMSKEMAMKLKGLKVAESKIEFEEIELESRRITRAKKVSESDKKQGRPGSRKRTLSQKFFEQGLAGIFIGSLPRDVTAAEIKEAVGKKQVYAAHIELIGRKGFAFAYFDNKPEEEDLLKKLKDLKVKERVCKVEVMRSPPRNSGSGDDVATEPKVKGIVAKEKRNVERTSPTSQVEKVRRKKTSAGDDKPRSKKTSSSEGEDQTKRIKEPKSKRDIPLGKEKTAVNKTRPGKTARGT